MVRVDKVAIGSSSGDYTVIENIIRFSCRQVSPEGALVEPIPVINLVQPATAESRSKNWEVELELDSDNLSAFRSQVINTDANSRALSDDSKNGAIGYFAAQGADTAGNTVRYEFESLKNWLSYHSGHVSNAPNAVRHPTLYRFICTGTRTVGSSTISGSSSTDERYTRITSVAVSGGSSTNVLTYDWELVGATGVDILYPRHTAGSYQALGVVEPSGKHWGMRLVFDSGTDIFNDYISETGANPVIPYAVVVTLQRSDGTSCVHTYEAGKCYITGNAPSSITERNIYNPGVLELICIGARDEGL